MTVASTTELLEAVYKKLAYAESEEFFDSTSDIDTLGESDCIEKWDWLKLAKEVKAEKVFFLNNHPIAVFARHDSDDLTVLRKLYNNIWCMARPRLLFLAKPGELAVYDLACKPSQTNEEWEKIKALAIAENAGQVASKLKKFHREQLESGRLFEDSEIRFGDIRNRADKALIRDLKAVRQELMDKGLKDDNLKYAHALIGRSIFIRYLEDREILIPEDFYDVAKGHADWKNLLDNKSKYSGLDCSVKPSLYPKVLNDKAFTFALFRKLAKDFNGDMFPGIVDEENVIRKTHLDLIRDLLYANTGSEKKLFFYAYQFKIIPIELISSIYEEFYHKEAESKLASKKKVSKANPQGAFYTPPALVEFLLSQALTPKRLSTDPPPRILDPACGSGIFLVESFRRIVRYRTFKQGRRLRFDEIRKILREQLAGIDIEPEAIRVAAFSLYLALLHYLDPPSIREQIKMGNRLPNLVFDGKNSNKDNYNTLLAANAFNDELIESNPILKKRFLSCCADIVVGNPPWGSPSSKDNDAVAANKVATDWCNLKNRPVGRKERSQMFMWKALVSLKPTGVSALLVHMNVFLMHHDNSEDFRDAWLSEACLHSIYNFSHTRKIFFKGAIAPFAAILFSPKKANQKGKQVEYWSSNNTKTVEKLQSVVFRRNDLKILRADQDLNNHRTWKIYWWGNHHDENLISYIGRNTLFETLSPKDFHCRGFEAGNQYDSDWLTKHKAIPTANIKRYGKMDLTKLQNIPAKVNRRGRESLYHGLRLLVIRGIEQKCEPKGQIVATLTKDSYAFRNSAYGIKLSNGKQWEYKCILGVLWSSLAKYYLLLTSYDWGVWHDEIRFEDELLKLPICFPKEDRLRKCIIRIVEELQTYDPVVRKEDIFDDAGVPAEEIATKRRKLEAELDDAIFELYGLGEAEIDLIRDMCDTNLEYYYSPDKSVACKPILSAPLKKNYGTIKQLPDGIGGYLKTFIKSWSPYLDKDTQLHWHIHLPPKTDSMIAVVFSIHPKTAKPNDIKAVKEDSWDLVLQRMDSSMMHHFGSSRVFIEGLVRAVTEEEILIIKRNENRLWTKSMAREDAEATLVQAMNRKSAGEMDVHK